MRSASSMASRSRSPSERMWVMYTPPKGAIALAAWIRSSVVLKLSGGYCSALAMPNAPSSIARRTMAVALSRSGALKAPIASPLAQARTVAEPTKEPMFSEAPRRTMKSSQLPNPCGPVNCVARRRPAVSLAGMVARSLSLTGAGVNPSPRIAVVIPWVTIERERPSPRMKLS